MSELNNLYNKLHELESNNESILDEIKELRGKITELEISQAKDTINKWTEFFKTNEFFRLSDPDYLYYVTEFTDIAVWNNNWYLMGRYLEVSKFNDKVRTKLLGDLYLGLIEEIEITPSDKSEFVELLKDSDLMKIINEFK